MSAVVEATPHQFEKRDIDNVLRVQAIVSGILTRLADADIPYCLLRNRELVPDGLLRWSDLDIMVPADITLGQLITTIRDVCPAHIVPFRDGLTYMFFPLDGMFLRVDFFHGEDGWLDAPYTDNAGILAHRWNDRGIMVASPLHQAYLTWCNRLVRGGGLPERYHTLVTNQMRIHPEEFRQLFADRIDPRLAEELARLAETGRLDETSAYSAAFKRSLWLTALRRHPATMIAATARHLAYGLQRRLRPPGLVVSIIGPDGELASRLCQDFINATSRPVPGLGAQWAEGFPGALSGKPLSAAAVRSALVLLRDRLIRESGALARMTFLFRDRDIAQLIVDPDQLSYTGPRISARVAALIAPEPDLRIILCHAPDEIRRCRPEYSIEEAARLHDAYLMYARRSRNTFVIDANNSPEVMMQAIMDAMAEITRGRVTPQNGSNSRNHANTSNPANSEKRRKPPLPDMAMPHKD